jgi:ubiquinone/menaquinone biosynthesis C-methylase UbiE
LIVVYAVAEATSKADGRLTLGIAAEAASVLAFDPEAEAVERARRFLPAAVADRVTYRVASANAIEIEPHSFDLVVFSWSLG